MSSRFLSICSGIEAASVALAALDWRAVGFAEIDAAASRLLAHRYPDIRNYGDFTTIDPSEVGPVDWLIGGTPCQAFSIAGKRLSLSDARGNLSLAYTVLAHELVRSNGLSGCIWENVPGVLSTDDNAFGCFLGALVGSDAALVPPRSIGRWTDVGMVDGPLGKAAWRILDAQYFGLAQRRRRVFVVASFREWIDPAQILFERKGVRRHPPPRGEAGQRIAGTLSARTEGGGGLGTDFDLDGGLHPVISQCLNGGGMGRQDFETETLIAHTLLAKANDSHAADLDTYVAHSLRANGYASEDGTGRRTPIVPVLAPTLRAGSPNGGAGHGARSGDSKDELIIPIAFQSRASSSQSMNPSEVSPSLDVSKAGGLCVAFDTTQITSPISRANPKHGDPCHTLAGKAHPPALAFEEPYTLAIRGRGETHNLEYRQDGTANALTTAGGGCSGIGVGAIATQWAVRRLTPTECERLQGFPDGYTAIPGAADGPRYKQLGNSFAVNVIRWIGERIPILPQGDDHG